MREQQLKKQIEKEEQEKLDRKMLADQSVYNPYGRSGGGAPLKDREGNIVADLSQVKADPQQYSPRYSPPPSQVQSMIMNMKETSSRGTARGMNDNQMYPPSMQQQQQRPEPGHFNSTRGGGPGTNPITDEPTFARGGNGIFGDDKVNSN